MPERCEREFDVLIYGASGFTGRLAAARLHERYGGRASWGLAGRDVERLAAIRDRQGLPSDIPLVHADANDSVSVRAMAARTRALISTVGPYQLHGSSAVAACAETGTDYVDMSGEPGWMREMLDQHEATAERSGARILFSCGFDSIPFDLGVHRLQRRCIERWGQPSQRIRCRVAGLRGAVSGGTAATRRATEAAIALRPGLPRLLDDPFLLTPGWRGAPQPVVDAVDFDSATGHWVSPFYMAFINTKHIHRTNLLTGHLYGRDFVYDEAVAVAGKGEIGRREAQALAEFDPFEGTESLCSGDGPDAGARRENFFDLMFVADGPGGDRLALRCHARIDPGYEGTARMMVETVGALDETSSAGGFWTPAALLGDALADRLSTRAGIAFDDAEPADIFRQETGHEF